MTTSVVPPSSGQAAPLVRAPEALARASSLVVPAIRAKTELLDPTLHLPVRHHLAGGGKHVRAALVLISATAVGGSEDDALPGAVAVELVHNYSLLHDDIIDGDRERRHRTTVWAEFGEGTAIVAGDALAALAMQVLLDGTSPAHLEAARRLADANQAMISGQSADMDFETRPRVTVEECLAMERGKTGALLSASCAIGAVLGGADTRTADALGDYGEHLGIAFQAVDDLLGVWGDPSLTGKPVGADLLTRKKALPVAVAFESGGTVADELAAIFSHAPEPMEVERATRLLERAGVRDAVAAIADVHLHAALDALDRVELAAQPKADLVEVARYVTARDR